MSVRGDALHPAVRAGFGPFGGFALVAATNAVAIAATVPWPDGGLGVRLLHHAFDAASVLGVGLIAGACVGLWTAFVRAPRWASALAYTAASVAVMHELLARDLARQACAVLGGRLERPLFVLYLGLTGLAIPALHAAGSFASRRRALRDAALAAALSVLTANHLVLSDDYEAPHGAVAWAAATLAGAAAAEPIAALASRVRRRAVASAIVVAPALLALAVPAPNAVRLQLFRQPCALGAWALTRTRWPAPEPSSTGAAPASPWWRDRRDLLPSPPTAPPLLAGVRPIVVLITIDAVRADVVEEPANGRALPTLSALRGKGADFTATTSAGSQTAVSLSTLFSGRYFSQLVWETYGVGAMRFPYPANDPSPRFPELLAARGVPTASFCGVNFLANEYGVARGFTEERLIATGRAHAFARDVVDAVLARLDRADDGPLFLYAHLMEPHAPYDRGGRKGSDHERYLAEIAVADEEIARVVALLRRRFAGRAYLIVTSDHGEAFGEHGTWQHTKTLYEEVLRVPLVIHGPGILPRRVGQRVGLVDLGPTVLDLFGLETPPSFMGQSLVPLLAGRATTLDRPLLAEGRLRRALYFGDLKVIDDERRKVVEVFDLARDGRERVNLFDANDVDRARADAALGALRSFFAVHGASTRGYVPIYKP